MSDISMAYLPGSIYPYIPFVLASSTWHNPNTRVTEDRFHSAGGQSRRYVSMFHFTFSDSRSYRLTFCLERDKSHHPTPRPVTTTPGTAYGVSRTVSAKEWMNVLMVYTLYVELESEDCKRTSTFARSLLSGDDCWL